MCGLPLTAWTKWSTDTPTSWAPIRCAFRELASIFIHDEHISLVRLCGLHHDTLFPSAPPTTLRAFVLAFPTSVLVGENGYTSGDDQLVRDGCMHVPIANGRPSLRNRLVCGGSIRASFVGTACLPGSSCSASRLERVDPAAALPPCQRPNFDSPYLFHQRGRQP
ncbi:hypothetical protein OH76DRAFT_872039 [Lentinus brumalis]|uniref:Uncharacterized protein n=1 Tax=Lentinus brumalis TaxID=2498619 RepID=A0A371DRI7_9APHY|nr:hypothetical protein OH76DRAFT_872039 [Polyporus brumalis]